MGLFSKMQIAQIVDSAKKCEHLEETKKSVSAKSINHELNTISAKVREHFKESKAELIRTPEALHEYVDNMIQHYREEREQE